MPKYEKLIFHTYTWVSISCLDNMWRWKCMCFLSTWQVQRGIWYELAFHWIQSIHTTYISYEETVLQCYSKEWTFKIIQIQGTSVHLLFQTQCTPIKHKTCTGKLRLEYVTVKINNTRQADLIALIKVLLQWCAPRWMGWYGTQFTDKVMTSYTKTKTSSWSIT